MTSADFSILLPEILLALFAMGALVVTVYTGRDKFTGGLMWATSALMVVLAFWVMASGTRDAAFGGLLSADAFARFAKVTILLSAAAVMVLSIPVLERRGLARFEYPLLVCLSVVGMMIMVSAGNLMTLYMGLELQSLALYVIASSRIDSVKSTEAGLKYFVLGALSSGLLLYGASLVYGFAGTTSFTGIILAVESGHLPLGVIFGLVFLVAGLAFKVSAVPFHMWTPDVYEGSPTPVTAFFATAPKVAAMGLMARLLWDAFGGASGDWQQLLAVLSVLSMFLGGIAAIGQTDIKRLMAYSSISHMGYALMGLAAGTAFGVQSMLTYMAIYVVMNIGTFAFILSMERDGKPVTEIAALNKLSASQPIKALALLLLMFSLAGVPPLVGFFAKLWVLQAAVEGGLAWLAIAGVIAAVINAFYYLRIVFLMYFGEEDGALDTNGSWIHWGALVASAAIMLLGVVNLFGIEGAAASAAQALVDGATLAAGH